jgi:hypothetical protein
MSAIVESNVPLQKIICNSCKHKKKGFSCDAFKEIPDAIIEGKNKHTRPLPNQKNNIVFEPKK